MLERRRDRFIVSGPSYLFRGWMAGHDKSVPTPLQ